MRSRSVAAAVIAAALSVAVTVSCASTGMTTSTSRLASSARSSARTVAPATTSPQTTSRTTGAPITALPAAPVSTISASTDSSESTVSSISTASATTAAPHTTSGPDPTIVETTITQTVPIVPIVPTVPTGTVVVIDPGHNGGNAAHSEIINKKVPAGFGQYKACNTTGTSTNAGYAEHTFNWKVAVALKRVLQNKGLTVVMTRESDSGVGPCVNERAAIGNNANAAAVISIHGDGEAANDKGFFVMTASRPPAGADIDAATTALANKIRDGMISGGFAVSNALGKNGLWARSDLGGLNLSLRPTVMIECGNMRNATEAAEMSSAAGQQRYAEGIAAGVMGFLGK
ncbi:MAG: N-acetylmuramoyl-L-alanine amidase [Nakamurella sp.]